MKLFEVTNTTWENLQIATHKSVSFTPHMYWFVLCNLQISQVVFVSSNKFTRNLFPDPIVFGINLTPFLDICSVLAVLSPGFFGFALLSLATARSQLLLFVVLAGGFGVSLRAATQISPSSPDPPIPSQTDVCSVYKTVVFSPSNALWE